MPEAVYTLSRAIGAYQTRRVLNFRGVASYTPQSGALSYFSITDDAHYMAMVSSGGDVEICDLAKNTAPYSISSYSLFGAAADRTAACGGDRFVLYGELLDDLAMIRFSDGEVLWHQQFKGRYKRVMGLGKDGASLLLLTDKEVIIINSENGEVLSRCTIEEASGGGATQSYKYSYSFSNGNFASANEENASCTILCSIDDDSFSEPATGVLTYYYKTGKAVWTPFGQENYQFEGVSQDTGGNILLAYAEKETDYILNSYYGVSYDSGSAFFDNGRASLAMIKEGTGEILWQNTVDYTGLGERSCSCFEIRTMPGDAEHPAREVVLAAVSNKIVLFDAADGTKIKDITLSDWVVSADKQGAFEPYARVNGASGTQYYFDSFSEGYSGMSYIDGEVDTTFFYHAKETFDGVSQFLVLQGNTIRIFKAEQGDNEFAFFGFEAPEGTIIHQYILGSRLVLMNDDNKIYIYDMENEKKLHEIELESENHYSYICSTTDQSCFYMTTSEDIYNRNLLRVDLEEGTCETVDISRTDFLTGNGKWNFDCSNRVVSGDYIFYRVSNYNSMTSYWFRYSMKDESVTYLALPYYEDLSKSSSVVPKCMFAEDGSKCVLYFDNALYLADFVSGTVTAIDAEIPGITYSTRRESDGMFAFYYQGSQESDSRKELHVYDAAGKPVWEINNLPEAITALRFYRDVLIVGTDNNRLYAYDARSGARKGMTELGGKLYHEDLQIYDGTDGDLIFDSGAGSVIMVNYENWAQTGAISDIIGYCPDLKWIISSIDYADKYGYCRYYSVDDLVEKGKAFVGEQTMSEADMATYGLN